MYMLLNIQNEKKLGGISFRNFVWLQKCYDHENFSLCRTTEKWAASGPTIYLAFAGSFNSNEKMYRAFRILRYIHTQHCSRTAIASSIQSWHFIGWTCANLLLSCDAYKQLPWKHASLLCWHKQRPCWHCARSDWSSLPVRWKNTSNANASRSWSGFTLTTL